ncbi:transposase [Chryseobacterium arthrosphaerae]|uniref:Transposase n=1 Tax=Chryseobacterium arthrosphaerae TaxID=651561 RepID=A0A432DT21_9FLAO|nr:transposase [Chryseobacterium arthrosphaerae]
MQERHSPLLIGKRELKEVQFFVAILGASQYTYAEASMSQQKEDFVRSLENAIRFFEGTPAAIVPDNLKSAVIKAAVLNPSSMRPGRSGRTL